MTVKFLKSQDKARGGDEMKRGTTERHAKMVKVQKRGASLFRIIKSSSDIMSTLQTFYI